MSRDRLDVLAHRLGVTVTVPGEEKHRGRRGGRQVQERREAARARQSANPADVAARWDAVAGDCLPNTDAATPQKRTR